MQTGFFKLAFAQRKKVLYLNLYGLKMIVGACCECSTAGAERKKKKV